MEEVGYHLHAIASPDKSGRGNPIASRASNEHVEIASSYAGGALLAMTPT